MAKNLVLVLILAHLTQIRAANFLLLFFFLFLFFSKIWLRQYLDVMVGYHYLQYQKKLMIQSRENSVMDGQTDRPTDRLTDGQE